MKNKNTELNQAQIKIECPKCNKEESLSNCIKLHDLKLSYQCNYCLYEEHIKNAYIRTEEWL